jgi:catechol 2,3-dioxygenase-like lactoylglutathione lyase family enzyme
VIDHIVIITADLSRDAQWLSELTGINGTYGGTNPVNHTHNMLFPLVDGAYLELLASKPGRPETTARALPFGLDSVTGRSVAGWAASVPDFDTSVARARAAGVPLGESADMHRTRPDGVTLRWRMTYPPERYPARLCPFLIDWGATVPPQRSLGGADRLALVRFDTLATTASQVTAWLAALGVLADARVVTSARCGFSLMVQGPKGTAAIS